MRNQFVRPRADLFFRQMNNTYSLRLTIRQSRVNSIPTVMTTDRIFSLRLSLDHVSLPQACDHFIIIRLTSSVSGQFDHWSTFVSIDWTQACRVPALGNTALVLFDPVSIMLSTDLYDTLAIRFRSSSNQLFTRISFLHLRLRVSRSHFPCDLGLILMN